MDSKDAGVCFRNLSLEQIVVCPFCGGEKDSPALLREHADTKHSGWLQRPISDLALHSISLKPQSTHKVLNLSERVLLSVVLVFKPSTFRAQAVTVPG